MAVQIRVHLILAVQLSTEHVRQRHGHGGGCRRDFADGGRPAKDVGGTVDFADGGRAAKDVCHDVGGAGNMTNIRGKFGDV